MDTSLSIHSALFVAIRDALQRLAQTEYQAQALSKYANAAIKGAISDDSSTSEIEMLTLRQARALAGFFASDDAAPFVDGAVYSALVDGLDQSRAALALRRMLGIFTTEDFGTAPEAALIALIGRFDKAVSIATQPSAVGLSRFQSIREARPEHAISRSRAFDALCYSLEGLNGVDDLAGLEEKARASIRSFYGTIRLQQSGEQRRVPFERIYVEQSLSYDGASILLDDLLGRLRRIVILGDPGGGKSTLAQRVVLDLVNGKPARKHNSIPLLLVLRELDRTDLADERAIISYFYRWFEHALRVPVQPGLIEFLLHSGRAQIILDGLDELIDTKFRSALVRSINRVAKEYPFAPILATSRRVGYSDSPLDPHLFRSVQLEGFSESSVRKYVHQWFEFDETVPRELESRWTRSFMHESESVTDLRSNPLMLQLMCSIYSAENYIPRNRPEIYEKCSILLFEKWDRRRNIAVRFPFDPHIQAAIFALAKWMYESTDTDRTSVPWGELIDFMSGYLLRKRYDEEGEARAAAEEFLTFCTGRAWVLADVGTTAEGEPLYQFTHRTFLEYFTARQISREHPNARDLLQYLLPKIARAEADVVAQVAVQLISSQIEDGADDFLLALVEASSRESVDLRERLNLLSFAARALAFVVPRPDVVRAVVTAVYLRFESDGHAASGPMYDVMCSAPETLNVIRRVLTNLLRTSLRTEPSEQAASLAIYPYYFCAKSSSSSEAHLEFWSSSTAKIREDLHDDILASAPKFLWVRLYLMLNGQIPIDAWRPTSEEVILLVAEDEPSYVRIPAPCTAFVNLLAHNEQTGAIRDDFAIRWPLPDGFADSLTQGLLKLRVPWRVHRANTETHSFEPRLFAAPRPFMDVDTASLYALLAAFQTDAAIASRDPEAVSEGRVGYWRRMTGGAFGQSSISSLPISGSVRGFLASWFPGGLSTVRRIST